MHPGDAHVGVVAEAPLEPALMLGLDLVVELVRDPLADLGEHGAGVEPRGEALDDRSDEPEVAQVARNGLRHPRVLHLDRDVLAVRRPRPMHLAERRERERLLVEVGEQDPRTRASRSCSSTRSTRPKGTARAPAGSAAGRRQIGRRSPQVEPEHREELPELRARRPSGVRS